MREYLHRDAAPERIADRRNVLRARDQSTYIRILVNRCCRDLHPGFFYEHRRSFESNGYVDLNRRQANTHVVGDVLQVVAEAAPDSETKQLTTIKSESHYRPLCHPVGRG